MNISLSITIDDSTGIITLNEICKQATEEDTKFLNGVNDIAVSSESEPTRIVIENCTATPDTGSIEERTESLKSIVVCGYRCRFCGGEILERIKPEATGQD